MTDGGAIGPADGGSPSPLAVPVVAVVATTTATTMAANTRDRRAVLPIDPPLAAFIGRAHPAAPTALG
ncbi:MAG: hypothetical protein R2746_15290 [Acidimicrobiales bacterium]